MSAVHEEYGRFLRHLAANQGSPDARRVANVVLRNLDKIIPTVNNGGQRTNFLVPLLRAQLLEAPEAIDIFDQAPAVAPLEWQRLKSLKVGPFRGFRREEEFDLSHHIVLVQGPNGSGKSSLCEAIELALLGPVEEASVKRIDRPETYYNNIHERRHVRPELKASVGEGEVVVTPNAELLRFAVIEKNRIESFARLAARTPTQAGPLIGSLLGLDAFNSFVGNFGQSIDGALNLSFPKGDQLRAKRAELETSRQTVEGWAEKQQQFDQQQEDIAAAHEAGLSYSDLLEQLGLNGKDGRLQVLRAELQEQIPPQVGLSVEQFARLRLDLLATREARDDAGRQRQEKAREVSFRDLYRSVSDLQQQHPDECPACLTPLDRVTDNPYTRAENGLEQLRDLADLEAALARHTRASEDALAQFVAAVEKALAKSDQGSLTSWKDWLDKLEAERAPTKGEWKELLSLVRKIADTDTENRRRLEGRQPAVDSVRALEAVKETVDTLKIRRADAARAVEEAQARIDGFAVANADLIQEEGQEQISVAIEHAIKGAYESFRAELIAYRDALPSGLLSDLNDATRDIYNSFNAADHADDLLASLRLPEQGGERITIALAGSPQTEHDALVYLSEGHLRCLGLAILLAKNIQLGLPVLIFDDAVNAIDYDHREAIRDTLFGDDRLREKQLIVTCHSPEFITQLMNRLPADVAKLYVLGHHDGDHQPRVRSGSDRHYLREAKSRLDDGDPRQAMRASRQALESLSARLWKSLGNRDRDLAEFPLPLKGPGDEPGLRALTEALYKAIKTGLEQQRLTGAAWSDRRDGLEHLLGINERNVAWRYLNKGTHDGEIEDFEDGDVRRIISALSRMSETF